MAASTSTRFWLFWGLLTLALVGYFSVGLLWSGSASSSVFAPARAALLPGATTHGHHQIELACETCHTDPFGGGEVLQQACMSCHGDALKEADDKHPASKFTDPRNAFRLDKIDAVQCVTCHVEHKPLVTKPMGLTQPTDYCFHCHAGPEEMPPDHQGLAFDGCLAAGCHNYHDNRALYEDFLLKHAHEPKVLEQARLPERGLLLALQETMAYPMDKYPFAALDATQADAPQTWRVDDAPASLKAHGDWLDTAHAAAGVNCSACHVVGANLPEGSEAPPDAGQWALRPALPQACIGCHAQEVQGFQEGLHGMRGKAGLAPMTPAQARLPMKAEAAHQALTCVSCHGAHRFETGFETAIDACLSCHDDPHSRAYKGSPHFELVQRERRGELPAGAGVSCATCHMPRMQVQTEFGTRLGVQHNQSLTLQPNEKMARPVCMSCHGLGFTLDALADTGLIAHNFKGLPSHSVGSIDMALRKAEAEQARRAAQAEPSEPGAAEERP